MFIKKYVKEKNTYYMLVVVEQVKGQEKPHFINTFIPEKLANCLIDCGVEVKSNEKK